MWQCSYNAQQDLARQFTEMGPNVDLVRFWAFQRFATYNGARNWEAFDRIVAEAKRQGKRLMFTFTDHWGACESQGGTRSDTWYTNDYKNALRGDIATYRTYVAEVVTRYKDEPQIAFWQLVNEAEGDGTALVNFANDMAGVVKAIDTNHLLSLGTLAGSQRGMDRYADMHAQMDVFEYHDYEDNSALPALVAQRIDTANAANKPVLMGELGRAMDPNQRDDVFKAKIDAQFARGLDSALVWNAHDSLHPDCSGCYGINMPNDPVWSMLGAY